MRRSTVVIPHGGANLGIFLYSRILRIFIWPLIEKYGQMDELYDPGNPKLLFLMRMYRKKRHFWTLKNQRFGLPPLDSPRRAVSRTGLGEKNLKIS